MQLLRKKTARMLQGREGRCRDQYQHSRDGESRCICKHIARYAANLFTKIIVMGFRLQSDSFNASLVAVEPEITYLKLCHRTN